MKKRISTKKAGLFLLFAAVHFSLRAQWTELGTFNQSIDDLKSFSGLLYVGGNFTKLNGNTCYWSATTSGTTSFTPQTEAIGGTGINRFAIFNNTLFATGGMEFGGTTGLASWTGSSWTGEGFFNTSCTGIYADGNDLYVGSDFGKVYKRTGNGAFSELPSFGANDNMMAFAKFNGQIIVGGQFSSVGGTNYNNIAAWNGSSWVTLGTGLSSRVRALAVYNNELYAAGDFSQAGGQNMNYIAKWNGTTWSAVGSSVTTPGFNGIRDMVVANNRLYVAGDFTKVGTVPAQKVASWNGSGWTALNFTESDDFPNTIEVHDGNIYIGTLDFTAAKLFRFDGTVAAGEPVAQLQFRCSPNPASSWFSVLLADAQTGHKALTLNVLDASGRLVLKDETFVQSAEYSCAAWPAGMYRVLLFNASGQLLGEQTLLKN